MAIFGTSAFQVTGRTRVCAADWATVSSLVLGTGVLVFLHSYALIVGLWQLLHPNERFGAAMNRPELRLLYVGLALVLRNEWVWLHFEVLSTPRRGGRLIRLERLRLRALLHWLIEVIEQAFGTIGETQTERKLCSDLVA